MEGGTPSTAPSGGPGPSVQRARPQQGRTRGPARRSTKGQWTAEEDEILCQAVERFKGKNWKKIAECFKDRTDVQCLHRWQKVLNPELVKGPWSKEEDEMIIELIKKYGPKKWSTIAQHLNGRIGKQCRERWHNHLNPAINKEAWTQEEELVLIRAHQVHGNKWAELTKFLPGRTDNSIKNHWNSSVKKKLDSYQASGLLAQFPALPQVGVPNLPVTSSSLRVLNSGVDRYAKGGIEAEEISECSQSSALNCSQSAKETCLDIYREKFELGDETAVTNEENTCPSPASCSDRYYPVMEDGSLMIRDVKSQMSGLSGIPYENYFYTDANAAVDGYKLDINYLPDVSSLEVGHTSTGLATHLEESNRNFSFLDQNVQVVGNLGIGSDFLQQILNSEDECCRILFSDSIDDRCFPPDNFEFGGPSGRSHPAIPRASDEPDMLCSQSIDDKSFALDNLDLEPGVAGTSLLHTHFPVGSVSSGAPCGEPSTSTSPLHSGDVYARKVSGKESVPAGDSLDVEIPLERFVFANDSASSPVKKDCSSGVHEQFEFSNDQSRLVPADVFSVDSHSPRTCSLEKNPTARVEKHNSGLLCYEPPRFPRFDVPFFSCDLIQSSNDGHQEYSPLGIRQLMMSSMKCISPFRLWDSSSQDKSPDSPLKSSSRIFKCTPSIIKKRHRGILSPLSDRRIDKKLVTDITVNLSRDFSQLEGFLKEGDIQNASRLSPSSKNKSNLGKLSEDKENANAHVENRHQHAGGCESSCDKNDGGDHVFQGDRNKMDEEGVLTGDSKGSDAANVDSASEVAQLAGILSEHDINDLLLFSPIIPQNKGHIASFATPRKQCLKSLVSSASNVLVSPSSCGNFIQSTDPAIDERKQESQIVAVKPSIPIPSSATAEGTVENASTMFGGTPFRRTIESPTAWKSPWFMNSFLPGPRIETEITIEDIGYFMSPGDKSYDALGLIEHLSELSAAAFAHAQEVLGGESPEAILKKSAGKSSQRNGSCSFSTSNSLVECRTLDFSECEDPEEQSR
ncbi:hypothetical protein MLD38_006159 [Melastoma candidum]|uniref:Uncharacterized protein n=1 Tax=Melastoma candidum TaxID=119954 RepID=A0ACB9RN79_9MYRT|nr:hypothetical protein MLD38_006159 [Melastoma candidum]